MSQQLPADIAALPPDQYRRLAQILRDKGIDLSRFPIPRRAPGTGQMPLSFAQRRVWFLQQLEPGSGVYQVPLPFRLTGRLAPAALKSALDEIVRRHEALRTVVRSDAEEPLQSVQPFRPARLPFVDLSLLAPSERETEARRIVDAELRRPFDLACGPLVRNLLLRLGPQEHILLSVLHHIACDGWSSGIWTWELTALYQAFYAGHVSPLPELPIQYADFALWQRDRLQGDLLARELDWWKTRLAGPLPLLDLPTDRSRPLAQTFRGGRRPVLLGNELAAALAALSKRHGATLFATLLAGFTALLHRYSGQDDILVICPIANRNRTEIEGLIGMFVNSLVLRVDLTGGPTFAELLGRVRTLLADSLEHQDLPFEKLVEELQPERDLSRQPLSSVMMQLQNAPQELRECAGVRFSPLAVESGRATFDLALSLWETGRGVEGGLVYNEDLFQSTTMQRLQGHFRTLLEGATSAPDRRVATLPLMTPPERDQIVVEWGRPPVAAPSTPPVHRLFEARARERPAAPALAFDGGVWTYGELEERANRLAHHLLLRLRLRPAQPVAVAAASGPLRIQALLAALKAGGCFVCLDTAHPPARLAAMLDEIKPGALLVETSLAAGELAALTAACTAPLLALDVDEARERLGPGARGAGLLGGYAASPPALDVPVEAPAYIAYTSGSTGRPKGIVQSHRSFGAFLRWFQRTFEVAAPCRIAQWTPIVFDPALAEIFSALCGGATLCLPPDGTSADPVAALGWLRQERISLLQAIPSFVAQLAAALDVESEDGGRLPDLEHLLLAGEPLPAALAGTLLARFPARPRLYNLYGPTEALVASCQHVTEVDAGRRTVPAGRPIDGCRVLVLDAEGEICPAGVRGEVYLEGACVADGYLLRPAETAASFVPGPLPGATARRAYRTGDVGRWLPDGALELVGRRDLQIKLRGRRVEIEEIEAVLSAHPAVGRCALVAVDAGDGDQRLAAWVEPRAAVEMSELRLFLEERVPAYMVPQLFLLLENLPLTSTGKVDRRALPPVNPSLARSSQTPHVAPRTDTEARIAAVWEELLGIRGIGVHDDFFELGGHSLLATRVLNRLRSLFFATVPLRRFFAAPSVAKLAEAVDTFRVRRSQRTEAVARLLEQVQGLSDQEVQKLVKGYEQ